MKLSKIKLQNFRSFGEDEQVVSLDDITTFIGDNGSGKTAVLAALNYLFSSNPSERVLKRSDFHVPFNVKPDDIQSQNLSIETVFTFDLNQENEDDMSSIPTFFKTCVVDSPDKDLYLRIRLEASWESSSNLEGAIESKIYYIKCPEKDEITEDVKVAAHRRDLDQIRFMYIPAYRDPSKQLKNVSGTIMNQMMSSVRWSEGGRKQIENAITRLNELFMNETGIKIIGNSIRSQWNRYDTDPRYTTAQLRFNSTDLQNSVKNSEVVFSPSVIGKECSIDDLSDGLRSLFYISLVDSRLEMEAENRSHKDPAKPFDITEPALTVVAVEEPENHIAPHLIGRLISNLVSISSRSNSQTIITSHSTSIIKRLDPENLRYFRCNQGNSIVKSLTLPKAEKLENQFKYVKEAVKAYPELYFAKLVILGEGDSEEIIIPKMLEAADQLVDSSRISIVPLGGRHINHFWRLLNDLEIPHITLLDLDREREGGCWGRIKYVINQLIQNGHSFKDFKLKDGNALNEDKFKELSKCSVEESENINYWIEQLEKFNVFFSAPLDIDFLMLEQFGDVYQAILTGKEGPQVRIVDGSKTKNLSFKDPQTKIDYPEEYDERIEQSVRNTLKKCGSEGSTYDQRQRELMVWYDYFFLNRGKPSTHIEAFSMIESDKLNNEMPSVFKKMIKTVEAILHSNVQEDFDEIH